MWLLFQEKRILQMVLFYTQVHITFHLNSLFHRKHLHLLKENMADYVILPEWPSVPLGDPIQLEQASLLWLAA